MRTVMTEEKNIHVSFITLAQRNFFSGTGPHRKRGRPKRERINKATHAGEKKKFEYLSRPQETASTSIRDL